MNEMSGLRFSSRVSRCPLARLHASLEDAENGLLSFLGCWARKKDKNSLP